MKDIQTLTTLSVGHISAMMFTVATVVFMSVYPTIGFYSATILTLSGCATLSWFCDDLSAPNGKYHKRMASLATIWDIYGELGNCLGYVCVRAFVR